MAQSSSRDAGGLNIESLAEGSKHAEYDGPR
jgi:hypothetical protein